MGGSSSRNARHPPSMRPLMAAPAAIADPAPTSIHVARCFRRLFTGLSCSIWIRAERQARCRVAMGDDYPRVSRPLSRRGGSPVFVGDHDGGSLAGKLSIDASSMMSSSDIASLLSPASAGSTGFRGFGSSGIGNLLLLLLVNSPGCRLGRRYVSRGCQDAARGLPR
jgi:hypothetical protein